MSSACTCHIDVKGCVYCKGRMEEQIILTDSKKNVFDAYKNGDRLNLYTVDGKDGESAEISLEKKQIKELMLFLDRKYGYLLEGVK
ncbi:hypothetical protein [Bacillus anthracis]|nr:hypothetical protein [Bacillus anthracis]PTR87899.1 hypothetical protein DBA57_30870 [Bacillus anthracis]